VGPAADASTWPALSWSQGPTQTTFHPVYLADDLRHERRVAFKVLKPELAALVGAERFLTEIKTTANLRLPCGRNRPGPNRTLSSLDPCGHHTESASLDRASCRGRGAVAQRPR
jgi:hypothetical protein